MSQKELAKIAAMLVSEYPESNEVKTSREFQSVLETVLPLLARRASLVISKGIESVTDVWQLIREDSEALFEGALEKVDRLKVIFVTSKFMNNQFIGEIITKQALEIARQGRKN